MLTIKVSHRPSAVILIRATSAGVPTNAPVAPAVIPIRACRGRKAVTVTALILRYTCRHTVSRWCTAGIFTVEFHVISLVLMLLSGHCCIQGQEDITVFFQDLNIFTLIFQLLLSPTSVKKNSFQCIVVGVNMLLTYWTDWTVMLLCNVVFIVSYFWKETLHESWITTNGSKMWQSNQWKQPLSFKCDVSAELKHLRFFHCCFRTLRKKFGGRPSAPVIFSNRMV